MTRPDPARDLPPCTCLHGIPTELCARHGEATTAHRRANWPAAIIGLVMIMVILMALGAGVYMIARTAGLMP